LMKFTDQSSYILPWSDRIFLWSFWDCQFTQYLQSRHLSIALSAIWCCSSSLDCRHHSSLGLGWKECHALLARASSLAFLSRVVLFELKGPSRHLQ
jgi:hypothetical protein